MQLSLSSLPVFQVDKFLFQGAQAVRRVQNYLLQSALHSNPQKHENTVLWIQYVLFPVAEFT